MFWFLRHPFFTINAIAAIISALYIWQLQSGR